MRPPTLAKWAQAVAVTHQHDSLFVSFQLVIAVADMGRDDQQVADQRLAGRCLGAADGLSGDAGTRVVGERTRRSGPHGLP